MPWPRKRAYAVCCATRTVVSIMIVTVAVKNPGRTYPLMPRADASTGS